MFHGHVDYSQKPSLGGRPNRELGDHGIPNDQNRWFILFYQVWGHAWIEIHGNSIWLRAGHIRLHTTLEGLWPHYMILEVCWDDFWTLSFGLSQFHGHAYWLVCEVALSVMYTICKGPKLNAYGSKSVASTNCQYYCVFVDKNDYLQWEFIYIMICSMPHWDTWDDSIAFQYARGEIITSILTASGTNLQSSMQEEDILEHTKCSKCHLCTLLVNVQTICMT